MDQGTFLLSMMNFPNTHGSFLSNLKSEVLEKFTELKALIENASGKKIKILRSDNSEEYVSNELLHICSQSGMEGIA